MSTILKTNALGQDIWLDSLSRRMTASHELEKHIASGVSGITTNPSIFLKAIQNDALYQADIAQLRENTPSAKTRYETLAIHDVQNACDAFIPLYQKNPDKGYVSMEVDPAFAEDTDNTIKEALSLWQRINRPNVMIKIPATDAGIQALSVLIAKGLNINMTLIFSREQCRKIQAAYIQGIKERDMQGIDSSAIRVVASFFISRIDAYLDPMLPKILQGKSAIALASAAYLDWQQYSQTAEFQELQNKGVSPIRLLWASTSPKNPEYSDTLYVDSLIGKLTVNTLPEPTLAAFLDHGNPQNALENKIEAQEKILKEIDVLGISLDEMHQTLLSQGLKQFSMAFNEILENLKR